MFGFYAKFSKESRLCRYPTTEAQCVVIGSLGRKGKKFLIHGYTSMSEWHTHPSHRICRILNALLILLYFFYFIFTNNSGK